nr:MAG TPA: hypothetical protein [Caudoviricetes sp.]
MKHFIFREVLFLYIFTEELNLKQSKNGNADYRTLATRAKRQKRSSTSCLLATVSLTYSEVADQLA